VTVVVLTGTALRQDEARTAAREFLAGCTVDIRTFDLPDGRLPAVWDEAKTILAAVADDVDVDLVLAPRPDDAHQDHRLVAEMAPTLWRDHTVLSYEIPKWDGDLGRPNVYVPLPDDVAHEKVRLLTKCFPSQTGRDWWDDEMFLGLARLRGMECRARYAEAFVASKVVLSW
jgi:LmbE family N-acetylglucosaminyl deacetylase